MWVARDKDNSLWLFTDKPKRNPYTWTSRSQSTQLEIPMGLFTSLKWEDEPIEVGLIELNSTNEEPIDDTIVLTRYYEDYEKEHEWFVNMLKHQERYKDCTDEEVEEIWKNHIKEEYTFDEIWNTIQCDGYTKIALRMGRHDHQPDYDYVLETKEYIDEKMKKYL